MQEATYAALYVLLGLAALMYTAHQFIAHGLLGQARSWLTHRRRPRLHIVKGTDHETTS